MVPPCLGGRIVSTSNVYLFRPWVPTAYYSQDTNTTQYELMRYIAHASRCVTIVGDPDQSSKQGSFSIVFFPERTILQSTDGARQRSLIWLTCNAVSGRIHPWARPLSDVLLPDLADFPNTQQIYLETNYRSTASILATSMAIISQGKQ